MQAAGAKRSILVVGPEELRVKRLLSWIRTNVYNESATSQNVETFFGPEISSSAAVARLKESLRNLSLFASSKLVILQHADKIKAQYLKDLVPTIENHSDQTVVILTLKELSQKTTALKDLSRTCTVIEVVPLVGNQLKRWVDREAVLAGASGIEPRAVEILADGYAEDISRLSQEVGKLALLTTLGEKISANLAEEVSMRTPERTSFELINQIAQSSVPNALVLVRDLLAQGQHPLQLSSFLSRCLRIMLAQKTFGSDTALPQELGNQWFVKNLRSATSRFEAGDLIRSLKLLKDVDFDLKRNALDHDLVITLFVQRVTARSFREVTSQTR